jgi:hypothetical protein
MLPHAAGEAESIADAFLFCDSAFKTLGTIELGERERELIATITDLMDTSDVNRLGNHGPWLVKAERLSYEQKLALSRAVEALAHLLERRYWETPK